MTPQLLSQKYLTRPYSKAPLSKLRVLFVWVSENIRLEGGPGRDVSGGRYKLGPAGDHMSALSAAAVAAGLGSPNMHRSSGVGNASSSILAPIMASTTIGSPIQYSNPAFTTGMEEFARGFLQEDAPELAQEVLTSRISKTGEGFANLFAEMALAAGIEDIGVVKGFIKGPMDVFSKDVPPANHAWNVVRIEGQYRFIDCCLASPFHPAHYPNRPQQAASFYFLTSPMDLVMSHFPTFLTYQYITPSIPPLIYLKMPFVRPAFFELGLNLVDFKRRSRLDIKDDENVEIVIRIDGCDGNPSSARFGPLGIPGDDVTSGSRGTGNIGSATCTRTISGMNGAYGGECPGHGCGEGIELRAEVEAMSSEGKVIRKRALAQVMIWNPYHQLQLQPHPNNGSTLVMPPAGPSLSSSRTATQLGGYATGSRGLQGLPTGLQPHHCSGVKIAKIKAVLPPETVEGPNGVRKGVVHVYAGRKVDNVSDLVPSCKLTSSAVFCLLTELFSISRLQATLLPTRWRSLFRFNTQAPCPGRRSTLSFLISRRTSSTLRRHSLSSCTTLTRTSSASSRWQHKHRLQLHLPRRFLLPWPIAMVLSRIVPWPQPRRPPLQRQQPQHTLHWLASGW